MALLPATLTPLAAPGANQQQARPVGLQRPARTCRSQPEQAEVHHAVSKHLTTPALVDAVTKEEQVEHAIVTKEKKVVKARSATMA